ncbi:DUF6970 domain-containing protein [Hymenobacter metallilatus]|uniref:DUF6970 domain-containing protein n=1 Tax=Hymenobacter metallilatus TaxID=2493666 RepID=A0A428JT06_9BACT|nr:hypothetical protein [Hymenobacter metallilatus]RSK37100.1 hypothetical protein EI290_00075 [Hymenobacter metallilatus]
MWLLLMGGATACSSTNDAAEPSCAGNFADMLIEQLKQKPKQTPAAEVTQYLYRNQTVYLVTGGNSSYVFDACGQVICSAAVGPNSTGDGRCPDFSATATNPQLLWRDPR